MAENINALILPIGADVSTFEKSIKEVKDAIKSLKTQIEGTSFNLVKSEQIQQLKSLENTLESLQNKVSQTNFNQFTNSSKQARTALNSLSLVAQDAPFGFIGIQNNLPGVIQSFGELTKQSGGVKGALSEIGKSLVGPAGLFLAFSAVTAAVTFAIKNYGSLGAAFNALTGNTNEFTESIRKVTKSLDEYNKIAKSANDVVNFSLGSQESQIIQAEALVAILKDSISTTDNYKTALSQLKTISEAYFGKLEIQADGLNGLDEALSLYTESLIKNAVAQNFASEAASVFTEFLKQNQIATNIANKINNLKEQYPGLTKEVQRYLDVVKIIQKSDIALVPVNTTKQVKQYLELTNQLKEVNSAVKTTANSYESLKEEAFKAFDLSNNIFKEKPKKEPAAKKEKIGPKIKLDALEIETQDLDAAFNLDKIISNITKYGNVLLDLNNKEADRKKALQELVAINPQVFSGLTLEKNGLLANKQTIESYNRSLEILIQSKKNDARASEINAQFRNAELKAQDEQAKSQYDRIKAYEDTFDSIVKLTYGQDQYGNSTDKQIVKAFEFTKALKQQQDIFAAINKGLNNIYGAGTAEENDPVKRIDDLSKRIKQAKDNFENTIRNGLQQPFEDFFSTLIETGKFSLDSFEGLFKNMLKKIAAQIVSAGIAKLISSILFPPGAAAGALAAAGAGNSSTGGIIGALVGLFGGRRSAMNNVNFGGVGGGPLQLAGAVNLQLRGSDLVGSINRTNSTINRVG